MRFQPIEAIDPYYGDRDYDRALDQGDHDAIRDLLMGRSVQKVAEDHLLLDDGTVLKFIGNEGGCACSAGDYDLTELNGVENAITSVTFEDDPGSDDKPCPTCNETWCYDNGHPGSGGEGHYRIFVFADAQRVNLATFEGSDGNGYYGTGYTVFARLPEGGNDDA